MLAAIACYFSRQDWSWFWAGAVFLGLSIAFKGFGIFLVPPFVVRLTANRKQAWVRSLVFAAVVTCVAAIWLLPLRSSVAKMVKIRLSLGTTLEPQDSSIWVLPEPAAPFGMEVVPHMHHIGYYRRRALRILAQANFRRHSVHRTLACLHGGVVDQRGYGATKHRVVPALLLLGQMNVNAASLCLLPYLLAGVGGLG